MSNIDKKFILGFLVIVVIVGGLFVTQNYIQREVTQDSIQLEGLGPRVPTFGFNNRVATTGRMAIQAGQDIQILGTTTNRMYAAVTNDCSSVVYLTLDNDAPQDFGIRLNANGGSYEINDQNLYTGAIRATSSAACSVDVVDANRF